MWVSPKILLIIISLISLAGKAAVLERSRRRYFGLCKRDWTGEGAGQALQCWDQKKIKIRQVISDGGREKGTEVTGKVVHGKAEPMHPCLPRQVHTGEENLHTAWKGASSSDRGQHWGCLYPSPGHKDQVPAWLLSRECKLLFFFKC